MKCMDNSLILKPCCLPPKFDAMSPDTSSLRPEGFPGQRLVVLPPAIVARAQARPVSGWLFPTHIGRFDHASQHHVERLSGAPAHVFILCLGGSGWAQIGQQHHTLHAGDAIILPPNIRHSYAADATSPWTILWLHLIGPGAEAHHETLTETEASPVFHLRDLDTLVEAFEETFRFVLGAFTDADLLGLSTMCSRFLGLCRLHQQASGERRRAAEERVLKVIRMMRENLHRQTSTAELAKFCGWSESHFSAVFLRQTQCSPWIFLTRLRLQRACEQLESTDLSIAEIAANTGFSDPFYFSRVFSRHFGISPSSYRSTYGG